MAAVRIKCRACGKHYSLKAVAEKLTRIPCPNCGEFISIPKGGKQRGLLRTIQATFMPLPGEKRPDLPEIMSSVLPGTMILKKRKRKNAQPHHAAASSLLRSSGTYRGQANSKAALPFDDLESGDGATAGQEDDVWTSAPDEGQTKKVQALGFADRQATARPQALPRAPIRSERPFDSPTSEPRKRPRLKLQAPTGLAAAPVDIAPDQLETVAEAAPPRVQASAPPSSSHPETEAAAAPPRVQAPPSPSPAAPPPQSGVPDPVVDEPHVEQEVPFDEPPIQPTGPEGKLNTEADAPDGEFGPTDVELPSFAEASEAELEAMSEAEEEEEMELNALGYLILVVAILVGLSIPAAIIWSLS